ncbi:MAG: hypothetical protein LAO09_02985 [Acidobacteriia bacterium]|nr:hypothetical protein [Terriglobia bacterium]
MKSTSVCFGLAILSFILPATAQVGGSGTPNTIPVWTGSKTLGDSLIIQNNGNVGIGTSKASSKLTVMTSSASGQAILARNTSTSQNTFPLAIVGLSSGKLGIGIYGDAISTTGANVGTMGVTASPDGIGVEGVNDASSGNNANGVVGLFNGTGGTGNGVSGTTLAPQGAGVAGLSTKSIGVSGTTNGSSGTAGYFDNTAGGNILIGAVNGTHKFRVDGTGKGFFDGGTQTGGADFAESVAIAPGKNQQEPGDLLAVDVMARRQLTLATEPYSTRVAGIYSTKPGVLATTHPAEEIAANEVPLAIVGIVPCKVSTENGSIEPGDLLVSSSTPGHAMKGTDRSRMLGAVVGKALEPLAEGKGVIQVLVTLQ